MEEIIDEESGILISTMLRQYFMALRTVGRWQKLADHWMDIASSVHHEPLSDHSEQQDDGLSDELHAPYEDTWKDFIRARLGHSKAPHDEHTSFSDHEVHSDASTGTGTPNLDVGADPDTQMDIDILLLRKFWTRWAVKAGIKSCPCDPVSKEACLVDWTRLIAPAVEGRVKMVQK